MNLFFMLSVILYATISVHGMFWNAEIPTAVNLNVLANAMNEIISTNQIKPVNRPKFSTNVPTPMKPTILNPNSAGIVGLNNFLNQINTTSASEVELGQKNQTSNPTITEFSNSYSSINENIDNFFTECLSQINSTVTNATQSIVAPRLSDSTRLVMLKEVVLGKLKNPTPEGKVTTMDMNIDTTQTKKYLLDALLFLNTTINSVDKFTNTINKTIAQQENQMKYLEKILVAQMGTNLSASCKPIAVRGISDIRVVALEHGFGCVYDEVDNYREIRRIATALIADINTAIDTENVDIEMMSNIFTTYDIVTNEFEVTQVRFQDCEIRTGVVITAKTIEVSTKIAACQTFGVIL